MNETVGQGRPKAWSPIQTSVFWERVEVTTPSGERRVLVAFTVDTPDNRSVTFWSEEQFEANARKMLAWLGKAPDGLVLADMNDLRTLGDVDLDGRPR